MAVALDVPITVSNVVVVLNNVVVDTLVAVALDVPITVSKVVVVLNTVVVALFVA